MPFEISRQDGYLLIRWFGSVEAADLEDMLRDLEQIEDEATPPHRVTDFTEIADLKVAHPQVGAFAAARRERRLAAPIKSALVAQKPLHFGYARMFETLNDNESIEIRVFMSMAAALEWVRQSTTSED